MRNLQMIKQQRFCPGLCHMRHEAAGVLLHFVLTPGLRLTEQPPSQRLSPSVKDGKRTWQVPHQRSKLPPGVTRLTSAHISWTKSPGDTQRVGKSDLTYAWEKYQKYLLNSMNDHHRYEL